MPLFAKSNCTDWPVVIEPGEKFPSSGFHDPHRLMSMRAYGHTVTSFDHNARCANSKVLP